MSRIVLPEWSDVRHPDQTTKQPVVWRCQNPKCAPAAPVNPMELNLFDFESDYAVCPKCGSGPPNVQKKVLVHFLVPDRRGNIVGLYGQHYWIACDHKREVIATFTNGEAGTANVGSVNCPGCIKLIIKRGFRSHGVDGSL